MDIRTLVLGRSPRRRLKLAVASITVTASIAFTTTTASGAPTTIDDANAAAPLGNVVPAPVSVQPAADVRFYLKSDSAIYATGGAATDVANLLAGLLRTPTGYGLPLKPLSPSTDVRGIALMLGGADASTGAEGYQLKVTGTAVTIRANQRQGLINGVATLRQLLPAKVDSQNAVAGPWPVQGGQILDYPRYAYRGALLDVARHFFPVSTVKRYIDDLARYKINYLNLHLIDDQGWRIQIGSWPNLTEIGGSTGVGGMMGGYYTMADYKAIVAYAAQRGITVIPEVEGPAHEHAALASYAELNCDGVAKELYVGYTVSPDGILCIRKAVTYTFLDQVIGQLAAATPGPYIAVGGDETQGIPQADLQYYYSRVTAIVAKYGKKVLGWQESLGGLAPAGATATVWMPGLSDDLVVTAANAGAKIIMAPAPHAYLDMKYDPETPSFPVGNSWAGFIDVQTAYDWRPEAMVAGVPPSAIGGVAAPLWTETAFALDHLENLAFPRLPAIAEVGWSPAATHNWDSFKVRLAAQGPRLRAARVGYYLHPTLQWPWGS